MDIETGSGDGEVRAVHRPDATVVVTVSGLHDEAGLVRLAGHVRRLSSSNRVVVDLTPIDLGRPVALGAFIGRLGNGSGSTPVALVHERRPARHLLRRLGASRVAAVLRSVEHALGPMAGVEAVPGRGRPDRAPRMAAASPSAPEDLATA